MSEEAKQNQGLAILGTTYYFDCSGDQKPKHL